MKTRVLLCVALLLIAAGMAGAQEPKPATHTASAAKPKAAAPAMDPKAMEAMMEKMAAPGPNHEVFKGMEGEWNQTVVWTMDPSQPAQESHSVATVKSILGGRYSQEETTGEMMGKPFSGMGLVGYDNILKKYVGMWVDNAGTGIMTEEGTADASGNVINWIGKMSDATTGKMGRSRMVWRKVDDNKHTFEMYSNGPDGKEFKMMTITYDRKM